ncbi:MAG TPA: transglutaminase family protein [Pirellulaceae bacterium]|nr:transglutaminase family protein [Pirellulaceae bacterium]
MLRYLSLAAFCFVSGLASAADESAPQLSVKDLATKVKNSIVVISHGGREGGQQGLGTGFVIDKAGLIATNLHVIGEARPISVQTADGKSLAVKAVHASDRALDLAIIQVEATDLPALELGNAAKLAQGEPVVMMGNPQGLKHSVVSGVVSGTREIDGRDMLQLAIPVEPGNSGGPVVDMQGRVLGIMTMKSLVTENLGFAVSVSDLVPLVEKPNPVPLDRWLTIGQIDRSQWEPLFGARWQQRAGKILVDGLGSGFGGRSLLLASEMPPELPYEVAVNVKLGDESGAAGLVFHADGRDQHYGFYPTNGKLRLSRFEGPDVFSWQVLVEKPSEHYKPGDWNRIKVRVEKDKLSCFVNDELVIESTDDAFSRGRVGLAKFRNTAAEFRRFAVAKELPSNRPDEAALAKLAEQIGSLPPLAETGDATVASLAHADGRDARGALLAKAAELEARAGELKRLAADVRTATVVAEFEALAGPKVEKIDLLRSALTVARLDEEDLEVEAYARHVERMADEIQKKLPANATEGQKVSALNDYLFKDNGFHGSRTDYYHRANSYLSRVIDDREGLPITLSVLYLELGSRLGLKIEGVGLPAHFVVRHVPAEGDSQLIDVFEGGEFLSREDAEKRIRTLTGEPPLESHFAAVTERQILMRILTNLIGNAQQPQKGPDREALIRYESAMLALDPSLVRDRGLRAVCRWETGRRDAAVADLQFILDAKPEGIDLQELRNMQEYFRTTRPPQLQSSSR